MIEIIDSCVSDVIQLLIDIQANYGKMFTKSCVLKITWEGSKSYLFIIRFRGVDVLAILHERVQKV